jgi:hypothetical protein
VEEGEEGVQGYCRGYEDVGCWCELSRENGTGLSLLRMYMGGVLHGTDVDMYIID